MFGRCVLVGLFVLTAGCGGDTADEAADNTTTSSSAAATSAITAAPTTTAVSTAPATTASQSKAVPNVVGIDLQLAQDTLQAAGFYALKSHDAKGLNRNQVLDRNWTVVDQSPKAGMVVPLNQVIDLGAVKDEEYQGR